MVHCVLEKVKQTKGMKYINSFAHKCLVGAVRSLRFDPLIHIYFFFFVVHLIFKCCLLICSYFRRSGCAWLSHLNCRLAKFIAIKHQIVLFLHERFNKMHIWITNQEKNLCSMGERINNFVIFSKLTRN